MKTRMDFVTNSSSSSFLLAKKGQGEISKEGREMLAELLIKKFINNIETIEDVTPENIDSHDEFEYKSKEKIRIAKNAMKDGFQLVRGYVSWEESDYQLSSILEKVLEILKKEENYRVVDDDLSW